MNSVVVKSLASLACSLGFLMLQSSPLLAQNFASHADASLGSSTWKYTVYNDEVLGSPNYVTSFSLSVNAPITAVSSPMGWDVTTDDASYVFWFNTDPSLPYPHDIAPGDALSGFMIESSATISETLGYSLLAWDHDQDAPGPSALGGVLAPSTPSPVPEASTWQGLGGLILGGLLVMRRRR